MPRTNTNTKALARREGKLIASQLDYICLDGSSSMADKWYPTLGGLDAFIEVLKTESIHSQGILSMFHGADQIGQVYLDEVISSWPRHIRDAVPGPRGMTALYDEICRMGHEMAHLAPERASIVIVTDGDDTQSHFDCDGTQARAVLDWCRANGWQVTFLGADFNNERQAKLLGANEHNMIGIAKGHMAEAGKALGAKRTRYARTGEDIGFTGDEKQQFGGYLAPPR